jgi:tetrahydromethanopterin S-methyltransferase subunit A
MPRPGKLELTAEEQVLLDRIVFDPPRDGRFYDVLRESCDAAAQLARPLNSRKAISEVRLRYFTAPALNIGSNKSRMQVFESNGTSGDAILGHANFLPYLRYFIFGPKLPAEVVERFWRSVSAVSFISGSDMDTLWQLAKQATRSYRLNPREACEEFLKLALECGVPPSYARSIRDTVRKLRLRPM